MSIFRGLGMGCTGSNGRLLMGAQAAQETLSLQILITHQQEPLFSMGHEALR